MSEDRLRDNAEARYRRAVKRSWRVSLFLLAVLAGALAWLVLLAPAWRAAQMQAGLGPDAALLGRTMLEAALRAAPAILVALGAWEMAAVLRRLAAGRATPARSAAGVGQMGLAVLLAGLMAMIGAPTLLGGLDGRWFLRVDFEAGSLALIVLGAVSMLAARAMREY